MRFWISLFATSLLIAPLVGAEAEQEVKPTEEEPTVRKVRFKKNKVSLNKRDDLVLSGNVQVKWQDFKEVLGDDPSDPPDPFPDTPFGVPAVSPNQVWVAEANLWIDHRTDCTWAEINYRYKQFAGKKTGNLSKFTLERAFVGYQFWDCPERSRFQVELGRLKISDRFQSDVQYCSLFDGALFGYGAPLRGFADLYFQVGFMVIDFRSDFYSYIVGLDLDEILCTGWYTKISFIDWARRSPRRLRLPISERFDPRQFSYRNIQWLVGYKFPKEWTCKQPVQANAGIVWNTAAKRDSVFLSHLGNVAWWVQLKIGKIVKKCDWAFKIGYQYVGLLSIFEADVCGIGRGNLSNSTIFDPDALSTPGLIRGNTNYQGMTVSFIFAATDNLSVQVSHDASHEITELLGGVFHYAKSEIKFNYVF